MSRPTGRYTDQDQEHYERPRRRTRPRTKERPTYDDAVDGVVVTVDRGRFTLLVDGVTVMAMKARPLGRKGVVVGDRVRVVGDVTGADGSLARIVEVSERETTLRRTADDDDPVERVIVANAEQLVIVTALADPEPQPRLIDRALVAAFVSGMKPLLCLTKADLADPETLLSTYRSLGVPWVVTQRGGDLTELRDRLRDRTSVLIGSSGVGKSTLVNALVPTALRDVGIVNAVTGRGRHTSTSAFMLALPDGDGWIIDTPGIRSFGLAHVEPEDLIEAFPDLDEMTEDCPRGCTHGERRAGVRPRRRRRLGRGGPGAGRVVPAAAGRPERADVLSCLYRTSVRPQTARAPASPVSTTLTRVARAATTSRHLDPDRGRPCARAGTPAASATTAKARVTQRAIQARSSWVCTCASCFSSGLLSRKLLPVMYAATTDPPATSGEHDHRDPQPITPRRDHGVQRARPAPRAGRRRPRHGSRAGAVGVR